MPSGIFCPASSLPPQANMGGPASRWTASSSLTTRRVREVLEGLVRRSDGEEGDALAELQHWLIG